MTIDTEVKQIDRRQIDINPNSFSFILQIAHKNYLSYNSFQTEDVLYVLNTSVHKMFTRGIFDLERCQFDLLLGIGIYSYCFLPFLFPF